MPKIKVATTTGGSGDPETGVTDEMISSVSFVLSSADNSIIPTGITADMWFGGGPIGQSGFDGRGQCLFTFKNPPANPIFRFTLNDYQSTQFVAPFGFKSLPKTAVFTQPAPIGSVYVPPAPAPNSDGIFVTPVNYHGSSCSIYYNPGQNSRGGFAAGAFGIKDNSGSWVVNPGAYPSLLGYTLANESDRIVAFDYLGTGSNDHLAVYRPGFGVIWIMAAYSIGSGGGLPILNNGDTGYTSPPGSGIQGISLLALGDRVFACGPNGESSMFNCLGFFSVVTGTVIILS